MRRANSRMILGVVLMGLLAGMLLLPACSIHSDKSNGQEKVDISTPVGAMHVSSNADVKDIGVAVYPGAKLKPKSGEHDSSANVNISTSMFGLRIVVAKYTSDDSPSKVSEFYKKELARYGTVLECHSSHDPGNVVMSKSDSDQLNCGKDNHGETLELKVGTQKHQHVVAITPSGKGTEFALVYLNARGDKDETL